jgi:alpha-mannosidase
VAPHRGVLPKRWGILEVSADDVVASALKAGRDGTTVLRVYEAGGQAASGVRVNFHVPIAEAREADLIEDAGANIASSGDALVFDLKPFEIRTFKFRVKAP